MCIRDRDVWCWSEFSRTDQIGTDLPHRTTRWTEWKTGHTGASGNGNDSSTFAQEVRYFCTVHDFILVPIFISLSNRPRDEQVIQVVNFRWKVVVQPSIFHRQRLLICLKLIVDNCDPGEKKTAGVILIKKIICYTFVWRQEIHRNFCV